MSTRFLRPERRAAIGWTRRRIFAAGLGMPFLSACSSDRQSDISDVLAMIGQSIAPHSGDGTITRNQAAAVPYASIGVRIGDSRQVLLALATRTRDVCLWTSSARVAIETRSGRITRTAGMPHNMSQRLFGGVDPLQSGVAGDHGHYEYLVDFPERNIYGASTLLVMDSPRPDEIDILGARLKLLHARERGSCSVLGWKFENEYWTDATSGFVWRSRQTIDPDLDQVEIVVFRPPA
jgi:hypothetical protein